MNRLEARDSNERQRTTAIVMPLPTALMDGHPPVGMRKTGRSNEERDEGRSSLPKRELTFGSRATENNPLSSGSSARFAGAARLGAFLDGHSAPLVVAARPRPVAKRSGATAVSCDGTRFEGSKRGIS